MGPPSEMVSARVEGNEEEEELMADKFRFARFATSKFESSAVVSNHHALEHLGGGTVSTRAAALRGASIDNKELETVRKQVRADIDKTLRESRAYKNQHVVVSPEKLHALSQPRRGNAQCSVEEAFQRASDNLRDRIEKDNRAKRLQSIHNKQKEEGLSLYRKEREKKKAEEAEEAREVLQAKDVYGKELARFLREKADKDLQTLKERKQKEFESQERKGLALQDF